MFNNAVVFKLFEITRKFTRNLRVNLRLLTEVKASHGDFLRRTTGSPPQGSGRWAMAGYKTLINKDRNNVQKP